MNKWHTRYLDMAKLVASWSKDPSTQCGAVIVDRFNRVVSVGFNGFPSGVKDDERLTDRDTKLEMVVHAEVNAIVTANRELTGCRLYTQPFMPCSRCAAIIIQSGINEVYAPYSDNERWAESFKLTKQMFNEAGVWLFETEKPLYDFCWTIHDKDSCCGGCG